jgi:hypothetical protein
MNLNEKLRDTQYLASLDKQLKDLRKELESDLAKYRDSGYLVNKIKGKKG